MEPAIITLIPSRNARFLYSLPWRERIWSIVEKSSWIDQLLKVTAKKLSVQYQDLKDLIKLHNLIMYF